MATPFNVAQILEQRRQKTGAYWLHVINEASKRASASLSDPQGHTTTINVPLPPTTFTIVSWNIQTFFSGKSLGNPIVNRVINRVLADLDADICILLESREESYINMNAIETNYVGAKGWKKVLDEEDEDPEDIGGGDDDDEDESDGDDDTDDDTVASEQSKSGGEPLTYFQIVSEMTGKVWYPPERVFLYNSAIRDWAQMRSDLIQLPTLRSKPNPTKYQKKLLGAIDKRISKKPGDYQNAEQDLRRLPRSGGLFAQNYAKSPKLFKKFCADDKGNLLDLWKVVLTAEEFMLLRYYYELCYLDNNFEEQVYVWNADVSGIAPQNHWRFLFRARECPACGKRLGTGMCQTCWEVGPNTLALNNLRETIASLTSYRCNCEESYSILFRPSAEVLGPSYQGVWLKDKWVSVKSMAGKLLAKAPDQIFLGPQQGQVQVVSGRVLGYADGRCGFRGRAPLLLPIEIKLPYHDEGKTMYMVAFHGPFGEENSAGIQLRAAAMREIMEAEAGIRVSVRNSPHVMIIGDFNLDYDPNTTTRQGAKLTANQLYSEFQKVQFEPMIPDGVGTSLASIHGASKWKQISPPTTPNYTSSAYDNCFLKSAELKPFVINACVVDVISWIAANLADFPLPADDPQKDEIPKLAPMQQAFYIYRKYVSDHLPVLVDMMVAPMTNVAKAKYKNAARNVALKNSGVLRSHQVVIDYQEMLEIELDPEQQGHASNRREVDGVLVDMFRGIVEMHQDDHLILRFEPMPGQIAWCSFHPPAKPSGLKLFLKCFPPGTKVVWKLREAKPINVEI